MLFIENFSTFQIIGFAIGAVLLVFLFRPVRPTAQKIEPLLLDKPNEFKKIDLVAEMAKDCPKTGKRYAVIGVGFVGRAIVEMLLARGDGDGNSILCIDMMKASPFEASPLWYHTSADDFLKPIKDVEKRIEYVQADITKVESLVAALKGKNVDVVFCTAALIAFHQRLDFQAALSYKVNVEGAKNVCNAMVECGIPFLLFTSTSNVALRSDDGNLSTTQLTEESALAVRENSFNHYSWTKAEAEKIVMKMHGTPLKNVNNNKKSSLESVLNVVALRPCSGVFGFFDRFMTQRLANAPEGQVFCASSDRSFIDHIYVNNLVFGQFLAEKKLIASSSASEVAGQVFNLVGENICTERIYKLMQHYYPGGGLAAGQKRFPVLFVMPEKLMEYVVAPIVEFLIKVSKGKIVPYLKEAEMMTPPMISLITLSFACNGDKAKKVLNYRNLFSMDECCQRLAWQYFKEDEEKKKQEAESKKKD
jgi:nucleoside-diphosphate-sugar epimerase